MLRTCSAGRSRTGRVIMPAWQKRQPRVHPRKISTFSRSCTTSVRGTSCWLGIGPRAQVGDGPLLDPLGCLGEPGGGAEQGGQGDQDPTRRTTSSYSARARGLRPRDLGQARRRPDAPRPVPPPFPAEMRPRRDLADHLLAVPEDEGVDEIGQRLGVEGAVAPGDHQRVPGAAFGAAHRQAADRSIRLRRLV